MKLLSKVAAGILGLTMIFSATADAADNTNKTPKVEKRIAINSASRLMAYYENGKKVAEYQLGLGKTYTPTPVGYFKILSKEINPPWIDPSDPEYEVPSGPDNPLGYRWMQIWGNYGIHGTNRPESIGGYVSNGCVRMREADVEAIFDAVEVGTPVDITYNRVVVEKASDGNVVYWIYPDGYGWQQDINPEYVSHWLEPYGVSPFESDDNINDKILASDGTPTYVGKPYNIEINGKRIKPVSVNGRKFSERAVVRDNISYLPAVPMAIALKMRIEWKADEATLKTAYGTVTGIEKKSQIYCNADDAIILFNLDGGLQNISDKPADGKIFRYYVVNSKADKKSRRNKPTLVETPAEEPVATDNNTTDKKSSRKSTRTTERKRIEKKIPIEEIETIEVQRINHNAETNNN